MIWRSVTMVIRAAGTETRESHAGSRSSAKKCDEAWRSIRTPCSRKQRTGSPLGLMNSTRDAAGLQGKRLIPLTQQAVLTTSVAALTGEKRARLAGVAWFGGCAVLSSECKVAAAATWVDPDTYPRAGGGRGFT